MESLPEIARSFFIEQDFVVLDTETTGKLTETAEIVEISILGHDCSILLNTLVKPTVRIPKEATAIHGITDEMVQDAPTLKELWPQIAALLKDKTVVVYNADYDIAILEIQSYERAGVPGWYCESWCLMRAYADYWKAPGRFRSSGYAWQSLGKACAQQEVELTEAHRSLGDTLATWKLLKKLAEKG